jgi:dolichol-phosphate mannosyltransferase
MPLNQVLSEIPGATGATSTIGARWRGKLIVVLPSYNEGPNLRPLFSSIHAAMEGAGLSYEIVLVDDGSADMTAEVLREATHKYPLTVVQHKQNRGLAQTIRDGFIEALSRAENSDVLVTMDADGTHLPMIIPDMIKLVEGGCDVVVASRFRPGAAVRGVPFYRQVLSVGASWMCRIVFPTRGIRDFTCGYRVIRAEVLKQAYQKYGDELFNAQGFACTMDLLLKLRRMKIVFGETPINLRYDLKEGKSKMRVVSTVYRTLVMMFQRRIGL